MKTGLVLEGGGMRGLYSVGVLDALMDAQILPAYIIGVSAGAANAVSYIAGQRERGLTVNTRYAGDKRYASFANFLRERSVFGMDFIFD